MAKIDIIVLTLAKEIIEKDYQSCLKQVIEIRRFMECARLTPEGYQHYFKRSTFYNSRLSTNQKIIKTDNKELILKLALIRIYQLVYFRSFLFV